MMMTLPAPAVCSLKLIDDIVFERRNGRNAKFFADIAAEWRLRVQTYIDEAGSPETIPLWPRIEHKKTSFLNLYSSPSEGSVQSRALAAIRNHSLALCPACGEAGAPNTLDHYLPKSEYPHFCITPYNLFPMCDACQNKKLDKTGDEINPRFFIHPYFHVFVAEQVIRLTIEPPFDKPSFKLGVVEDLSAEEKHLVGRHVRELDLPRRYGRFFREQHMRLLRLVQRMRESDQVVSATLETLRLGAERPSRNSWEHVFYASVLSNERMVEYLEAQELPAHL